MSERELISFWVMSPLKNAPLGFGVTAHSLAEALAIIRVLGYGPFLPNDTSALTVQSGINPTDLSEPYVAAHAGPVNVRGMWYPFVTIGVPQWAEERLTSRCS